MSKSDPIKVGIKKGTFYLSQNEDGGSGWEKQEFNNSQTGEPMVKYHKNISLKGAVVYLGMKDDKFKGNCFSMLLNSTEDNCTYSLEIKIKSDKGVKATDQYFNSLVGSLENVSKGDEVTMFVNNKNKDKNDNLYRNVVTLDSGGKLIKSNFQFTDVPRWDSETTKDEFGKEVIVYDPTPTNKFYITKFMNLVERFKGDNKVETENTPQHIPNSKSTFVEAEEDQNLPF